MEKTLGPGRTVFQGETLAIRVDPVSVGARQTVREVVERGPAVVIVAHRDDRVAVIRQYRWAVQELLVELPAGRIEPGEAPEGAARRELREETGIVAGVGGPVLSFYPSPGYSTERIHLFHFEVVSIASAEPDPDEEISWEWWTRDDITKAIHDLRITNGLALVGFLWWLQYPG